MQVFPDTDAGIDHEADIPIPEFRELIVGVILAPTIYLPVANETTIICTQTGGDYILVCISKLNRHFEVIQAEPVLVGDGIFELCTLI